jgi:1-acyl-sn-glycerol-3-phosphate acyltransferase
MIDTEKIQPPGKVVPKLMRPGIRIGAPLDFTRYRGMEGDRFILRSLTDEVMYEIMKLSGQEYVDVYATAAKRQLAEAEKARRAAERTGRPAAAHTGAEETAVPAGTGDTAPADHPAGAPGAVPPERHGAQEAHGEAAGRDAAGPGAGSTEQGRKDSGAA